MLIELQCLLLAKADDPITASAPARAPMDMPSSAAALLLWVAVASLRCWFHETPYFGLECCPSIVVVRCIPLAANNDRREYMTALVLCTPQLSPTMTFNAYKPVEQNQKAVP